MKLLNRTAVVVKPRQPYADWLACLDGFSDDDPIPTLVQLRKEGRVYLLEERDAVDQVSALLDQHWQKVFENELSAWDEFADNWPALLNRELFNCWFDFEPQLMVFDVAVEPLMIAALD